MAIVLLGITGCGSPPANPESWLLAAKERVDAASSVQFVLSSSDVPPVSGAVVGGSGLLLRPASFSGTLTANFAGVLVQADIVSIAGNFWARTLLTHGYVSANPEDYGFGDPGQLLSPRAGFSSLLAACAQPRIANSDRYMGEELVEVSCSIPGTIIANLLTSADPKQSVAATFGITADSHELRRVVLRGPFYAAHKDSTFTLILRNYDAKIAITPPAVPTS